MSAASEPGRAPRRVALVEWHVGGHHLTYYLCFARVFRELGFHVVALHVDTASVEAELDKQIHDDWRDRIELRSLALPSPWPLRPTALYQRVHAYRYGLALRQAIRQTERIHGRPMDCVWISCLYKQESEILTRMVRLLERPWAGLYLQPASLTDAADPSPKHNRQPPSMARLLRDRPPIALAVIDEYAAPKMSESLERVPVAVVPDLTDLTVVDNHPLAQKFRHLAGGRPLVLLIGHLIPSKGATTLARVAADPRAADLAFAFVGEIVWHLFRGADAQALHDVFDSHANTFSHNMHVPDGPAYNAIIDACSVLFAAYHDFPHSSNTLTKAALLRKPIIVSDGYVMAKRVREYRLGEVVPQNDPAATLAAIRRIADDPARWARENNPRWDDYLAVHSYAALVSSMGKLCAAAFQGPMVASRSH